MAVDNIPGTKVFRQRDVRETPAGTINIAAQIAPIGSVIAWLKSFANVPALPDGWVECDGAAINDADSVFNGQNTPDLNGGIFLEGRATSGATGGSATMAHTHTGPSHTHGLSSGWANITRGGGTTSLYMDEGANSSTNCDRQVTVSGNAAFGPSSVVNSTTLAGNSNSGGTGNTGAASNAENRPPFYTIVWIMRIK